MLDKLGIESEFRGGLRVTTPEAMDVVRMVLVGQVQRELVGLINEHGPLAVGLSGEDAGLFTARQTNTVVDGEEVDLGLVGEVSTYAPRPCSTSSRRSDPGRLQRRPRPRGIAHNVNADSAAAAPGRRPGGREAAGADRRRRALPRLAASDDVVGEISRRRWPRSCRRWRAGWCRR
jgi:acetylglutamate kinase